jgi:putative ABC transport system permease protein
VQLDWLAQRAEVSPTVEMRAMARPSAGGERTLIDLKGVAPNYPLVGTLELAGGGGLHDKLARRDGVWGAVIDDTLLRRLDLSLGDRIRIGDADYELRDAIVHEPDRGLSGIEAGPRVMVAEASLAATDLIQPGSLIRFGYHLALDEGQRVASFIERLEAAFPDAGWRIRDVRNPDPSAARIIGRLAMYLTLIGLAALLVGGVGVGNAVRAFLETRLTTIAALKCLGAPGDLVFRCYFLQILILACAGILLGLALGAAVPLVLGPLLAGSLDVRAEFSLYWQPLALAALFGLLTALLFAVWPLGTAREVPAAGLFRGLIEPPRDRPRAKYVIASWLLGLALAGLAIGTAEQPLVATIFAAGAVGTLLAFRGAAELVMRLAARLPRARRPALRLAVTNLFRPGAPTVPIVQSLGIGLTVLVASMLIEGNLQNQVSERLPEEAPAFFFVDIQNDQVPAFDATVKGVPGASNLQRVPSLRGRIVRIDGVPVAEADIEDDARWAVNSDRGVTYAAKQPAGTEVVAGEWWPADYDGPPLISFNADLAEGFHVGVGDTITLNILGREVTAEIANLRHIDWGSFTINFNFVFAPGTLEDAPHTHLATVHVPPDRAEAVFDAVTDRFANITVVSVRDILDQISALFGRIAAAARAVSGITLAVGTLVLAGALAATQRRRIYDAVVLKVVGATRASIVETFAWEFVALGLLTAVIAGAVGTLAAWFVVTEVMDAQWVFLPRVLLVTLVGCTTLTLIFGMLGTWRSLSVRPARLLRNE